MEYKKKTALFLLKHISLVLLFIQLISFALLLNKCYYIQKINYLYICIPFLVWSAGYFTYRKLADSPALPVKPQIFYISAFLLVCLVCTGLVLAGVINIFEVGAEFLEGINKLRSSFTRSSKYSFREVLYPLVAASFILSAFYILFDRNRLGIINVVLSLVILYLFWSFRTDKVLKDYLFVSFLITVLYYGLCIYYRASEEKKGCLICTGAHGDKSLINLDKNSILVMCVIVSLTAALPGYMLSDNLKSKGLVEYFFEKRSDWFHYGVIGFSQADSELGGSLKTDESVAFYVWASRPYYLRAEVKDLYTGSKWLKLAYPKFIEDPAGLTALESRFSSSGEYKKETLKVQPRAFRNNIFLAPLYTYNIKARQKSVYTSSFIFQTFNSSNISRTYEVDFFTPKKAGLLMARTVLPDDDHSARYRRYLQIPGAVTGRTRNLVTEITGSLTTPYEKMDAIKSYLMDNYTYSLKVSDIPEENEFVDYFLFSEKKGYCTYYASAATILLRLAGIPARYVTGYAMTGEKDEGGAYIVRNSSAHAWTEVLVDPEQDLWTILDCVPLYNPVYEMNFRYANWQVRRGRQTGMSGFERAEEVPEAETPDRFRVILKIALYVLLGLAVVTIIFTLILSFFIYKHQKRKKKVMSAGSAAPFYFYLKKRLATLDYRTSAWMCETEFLKLIENSSVRKAMEELVQVYYDEFFGNDNSHFEAKESIYKLVEDYIRGRQRFLKYTIKKLTA